MVRLCHNCDDKNVDTVCTKCFNNMIYKTDAMKKFGISEDQLDDLFCIEFQNFHKRSMSCYKYNKDDLYKLQDKLINTLPKDDKQLKLLIKKKNLLEDEKKRDNDLKDMKKNVKIQLYDMLSKLDNKYVKIYKDNIEELIEEKSNINYTISDISLQIYNNIEELIKREKKKNDDFIEKTERTEKINIKIDKDYKDFKNILLVSECYVSYINKIIDYKTCISEINNIVKENTEKNERIEKVKKKIEKEYKEFHDIIVKSICYENFINNTITFKTFINEIKDIVNNEKEKNERIDKINIIIEEQYKIYKNLLYKSSCYDKYANGKISFEKVIKIFDKIHLDEKNKRKRIAKINSFIKSEIEEEYHDLIKKDNKYIDFINDGDIDEIDNTINEIRNLVLIEKQLKIKIQENAEKRRKILEKEEDNKNIRNFFYNNPPGSSDIPKDIKYDICNSLYNFSKNSDLKEICVDLENEYMFFLKNKLEYLHFKYKCIEKKDGINKITIIKN